VNAGSPIKKIFNHTISGFVNFAIMMQSSRPIKKALISVFHKDGLENLLSELSSAGCEFISTGGTSAFIKSLGYQIKDVNHITGYPEILGGRVKTLHPAIFGGILSRTGNQQDAQELSEHGIEEIDLVVVDLYPFSETLASGASEAEIIEKIDIGGISLIRAAAKNYHRTAIVSDKQQYSEIVNWLRSQDGAITIEQRKKLAYEAFAKSSAYDSSIMNYFAAGQPGCSIRICADEIKPLRYGENPHQKGWYYGDCGKFFTQLNGKEISYNNFLDIDAAFALIKEFDSEKPAFIIIKHNNACGAAIADQKGNAWKKALASDPLSAFGGVIITQTLVDEEIASEIDKIFFEVLIAPEFTSEALDILKKKSNRIILKSRQEKFPDKQIRTCLDGYLVQETDNYKEKAEDFRLVTQNKPEAGSFHDIELALKICKHSKSNAIILVKDGQLIGSGAGLTSRVDALRLALERAKTFGFSANGACMASDAFFPFADCVEIAAASGIKTIVQPGGSIKDKDSIEAADRLGIGMFFTGVRHFRH
jgi:phosphoribosylaminoimidazolecarboxamide formyltransferase/IMP cyclohydrolase